MKAREFHAMIAVLCSSCTCDWRVACEAQARVHRCCSDCGQTVTADRPYRLQKNSMPKMKQNKHVVSYLQQFCVSMQQMSITLQ